VNGVFSWTAPMSNHLLTNTISVRVTDDGVPPLSNAKLFRVIVIPPPALGTMHLGNNNLVLNISTFPGKSYRVQYKDELDEPGWTNLEPDLFAHESILTITNVLSSQQRFYRILQLD
ncbi:MAG: hypothetical protein ACK4UN_04580, partial [Limisphaerales bacterium]